jgi:KUP system potassium uptake protein
MKERWKWTTPVVTLVIASFLVVDLTFFGANITKVPAGGWFPLVIGVIGFVIMATWKRGRELMTARLRNAEFPAERFIQSIVESDQQRASGTGVYLHSQPGSTPPSLITNLRHHEVLHEKIVLVSIQISRHPRVQQARRSTVHDLGEGFYQVELLYGFMEQPDVPFDLKNIVSSGFGFSEQKATYFLGKETILATDLPGMAIWRERLFSVMHRNSSSAANFFNLPHDRVVEVGIQVAI